MYESHLSHPYNSFRGQYDAFMNGNTSQGSYNALSGSAYNLKSSYELPDNMYRAVNSMMYNARQQLGGLESRLY